MLRLILFLITMVLSACNSTPSVEEGFLGFSSTGNSVDQSTSPDPPTLAVNESISFNATPSLTVSALKVGDTVRVYSDSLCTAEIGSAVATSTTMTITTSTLTPGSYTFYGKISRDSQESICSITGVSYEVISVDQIDDDNTSFGFGGGTHNGTTSASGSLVLSNTANSSGLDSSWTPQYANLTNYWNFDADANDQIGSNNCTPVADAQVSATSKVGAGSAVFDGTADNYTCGVVNSISSSSAFTLIFWYKRNGAATWIISGHYIDANNRVHVVPTTDGRIVYNVSSGGNGYGQITEEPQDDKWHHVAMVYDGSQAGNDTRLRAYFNGQQKALTFFGTIPVSMSDFSATDFNIGTSSGLTLDGNLDEVAIWNVALSSDDIRTIYNRQSAKFSGEFTSRIINATLTSANWTNLEAVTTLPFNKPLVGDVDGDSTADSETSANYSSMGGDLGNGLIALWNFDELSSGTPVDNTTVTDSSGQGNNANVLDSDATNTIEVVPGVLGNAMSFDGVNDRIQGTNGNAFVFANQIYTVSAYFRTTSASRQIIVTHVDDDGVGANLYNWAVEINNGIVAAGTAANGQGTTLYWEQSTAAYDDGKWHHVLAIMDHRPASEDVRLFIDGVEQSTNPFDTRTANNHVAITGNITIGARFGLSPGLPFDGEIDEVAIWNRELTSAEVLELYRRVGNRVKYQIRSCDDSSCSGESWIGPDGTNQTYFSEDANRLTSGVYSATGTIQADPLSFTFADFTTAPSTNRYFQYRAILESDDQNTLCSAATCLPSIERISIGPTSR